MPWSVKKHSSCPPARPWAVVKDTDGSKVACHRSRSRAVQQQRALYASEAKSLEEFDALMDEVDKKEAERDVSGDFTELADLEEVKEKSYDEDEWQPLGGATSFDEMESIQQMQEHLSMISNLGWTLQALIRNILNDDSIEDKASALSRAIGDYAARVNDHKVALTESPPLSQLSEKQLPLLTKIGDWITGKKEVDHEVESHNKAPIKRENGLDFPARDYAFVPDPASPATWKLRLTESPGKVTVAQLARAALALSSKGFRGNRAIIPIAALSSVKRRIRAEYRKLGVPDNSIPASVKSVDDDMQPMFVWKNVATGNYQFCTIYSNNFRDDDYPPEILSEKAHTSFHEAVELGIFDYPELWHWHLRGTRWGKASKLMYVDGFAVALGDIDPGHEKEAEAIANLPYPIAVSHGMPVRYIVRNKEDSSIIDFYASEEISVLPFVSAANKWTGFVVFQQENTNMPLSDKQLAYLRDVQLPEDVINGLNSLQTSAKAAEDEGRDRKSGDAPEEDASNTDSDALLTAIRSEVTEAFSAVVPPLIEALKALAERQNATDAVLKELQVLSQEGVQREVKNTPRASLADLVSNSIFGATNEEARVDARTRLGKSMPKQAEEQGERITGSSFLDGLISKSWGGGEEDNA